jgi:hypothetical protein
VYFNTSRFFSLAKLLIGSSYKRADCNHPSASAPHVPFEDKAVSLVSP